MVYLLNTPSAFADEMLHGFAAAYGRYVRAVPGGVVRSSPTPPGQVALVIGGGSGHYPAFGGLVGPGLAAGAAMGNIFASPSAQQVESVARAADGGAGVLFAFGNYMGDVLNFAAARDALAAGGIETRTILVTDDVASAPVDESDRRRGIAGDLTVFKTAGAAAAAGLGLDQVHDVAARANARTFTLGVAFSGCSLPGSSAPLFTVEDGTMAVGMGIHGEPGLGEVELPTADDLAALLVERLLEESAAVRSESGRAAVVLNGLGRVKYEELFVVYRRVHQLLERAGIEVVDPEVGEFVTSFDMAGVSLTLMWLDGDLERWWSADADSPAFRRGSAGPPGPPVLASASSISVPTPAAAGLVDVTDRQPATAESRATAAMVVRCLDAVSDVVDREADRLGRLDAVAGDGDHGIGMQRGARAARRAARACLTAELGAGTTLRRAADAWSQEAGGTSGVLWGVILRTLAEHVGDQRCPSTATVAEGMAAAAEAVTAFGGAALGDKTLVDALSPFSAALAQSLRSGLAEAWVLAAEVAEHAAGSTADLVPRTGRARPHADRSVGTPDPGAISFALIVRAVATTLTAGATDDA